MNACSCKEGCRCTNCTCDEYAAFFDILSHPTRWKILQTLEKGPKKVSEISKEAGVEQTCTSHCLRKLEQAGFVSVRTEGRNRIYSANGAVIGSLKATLQNHIRKTKRRTTA